MLILEERNDFFMCTVSAAFATIGAGAHLYSSIAEGKNAEAQANAQANALEQNAAIARAQGHDAIERGGLEELRLRRELAQYRGNQRTQAAASGIDINSGSALDAQNATIAEGEHDAAAIRYNAARERWGYEQQAANMTAQAQNLRTLGKYARKNSLFAPVVDFGLSLGEGIYDANKMQESSPLIEGVRIPGYAATYTYTTPYTKPKDKKK